MKYDKNECCDTFLSKDEKVEKREHTSESKICW